MMHSIPHHHLIAPSLPLLLPPPPQVMEVVQTLDAGRRNAFDPDEIEEEQRERERRNKINNEFNQFVKRVQEVWEKDFSDLGLEFDIPFRELGFHGTPFK